jgi:hypothetical protein
MDTKFPYRVHKGVSLVSTLKQKNPVHNSTLYFPKVKVKLTLSTTPWDRIRGVLV